MADTFTTNLNLTKPELGAAEDTWGISLNADLDALDAIFSSSGTQINLNPNQVNFGDNKKAVFGAGSDLQIYHDGTHSYIEDAGTGQLRLQSDLVALRTTNGETSITATQDAGVSIRHNNITKLETTSTGIDVTGTVTTDGLTTSGALTLDAATEICLDSDSGYIYLKDDGTSIGLFKLTSSDFYIKSVVSDKDIIFQGNDGGSAITALTLDMSNAGKALFSKDIGLVDNGTAFFGSSGDLKIYHDGANSYIQNVTNSLIIQNDSDDRQIIIKSDNGSGGVADYFRARGDTGEAIMYHYGSQKLATTSTGIDVTGTATMDGLTVDGDATSAGTIGVVADGGTLSTGKDSSSTRTQIAMYNPTGQVAKFDTNSDDLLLNVADNFRIYTADSERLRLTSTGNLGLGTTSPSANLHVSTSSGDCTVLIEAAENASGSEPRLQLKGTNTSSNPIIEFGDSAGFAGSIEYENSDNSMRLGTNGSERIRINSVGNLLVGTTDTFPGDGDTNTGVSLTASGSAAFSRSGFRVVSINRNTDDGTLIEFNKDGSAVGSIGVAASNNLYIGASASGHAGLYFDNGNMVPMSANLPADDAIDLGSSLVRFDDIYATNGTIQTSDINEKQDIEDLSEAETRVAVAAKGLLKKYRWKSAVEEKGDDARIHFGIMAQDLQNAFTAEGLDAGDYGMFISTTWTNDDGVEQTRLGVRYNELLAFIIAAI